MLDNNLFNIEKYLGGSKPAGLSQHEKIRSWNAIEGMLIPEAIVFSYTHFWRRTKSRIIATVLGLLILAGGGTTAFAHNAGPGDVLFPVAIASEKAQILFTADQKTKESLRIKFAEKRLTQVKKLRTEATQTSAAGAFASSTINTHQGATTTPLLVHVSDESHKKIRVKKAVEVALAELKETRSVLLVKGNLDAVSVVDDIIDEVEDDDEEEKKQEIEQKQKHRVEKSHERNKRKSVVRETTFVATTTGTTTFDKRTTTYKKINELDTSESEGASESKTEQRTEWEMDEDEEREDQESKHGKNEPNEDDAKRRGRSEKIITICHLEGTKMETLTLSTHAGRAHLVHGDALGVCP